MIVEEVSLSVAAGEVLALLGHNRASKSTLLRALFGLLPCRDGHVEVQGTASRAVMLDEPSIGLAPRLAKQVFATIRAMAAQGRAILLVAQSVKRALAVSDRAVVMEMGRIVLEDSAASLAADDRVAKLYMGAAGKGFAQPPR
ncbi:MAG TPA: ATP-binding cassette domain-containing protein [Falsiroseomonas sp.]|nr:ATP-binding cassette domain-containing protein [Falsiroseomonas sp.]